MRWALLAVVAGCGRLAFDPATGDASASGDGSASLSCTTETFDVMGPQWYFWSDNAGVSAAFTGGQLAVTLASNQNAYAGIDLRTRQDLTGGSVAIELTQMPGPMNEESYLIAHVDPQNQLVISYSDGTLTFDREVAGSRVVLKQLAIDKGAHRWCQIRHNAATNLIEFATSPDGATWTVQQTDPPPFAITALELEVASGTFLGGVPSPSTPRFDNLRYCMP